jgi:hypothetical protein
MIITKNATTKITLEVKVVDDEYIWQNVYVFDANNYVNMTKDEIDEMISADYAKWKEYMLTPIQEQ